MDDFEQKLQRQPLRHIPSEWRGGILSVVRAIETPRCGVGQRSALSLPAILSILNRQLSTILWPHPKAWAGLGAVWGLIFIVNFSMRDKVPVVAERSTPLSQEVVAELKLEHRMWAELVGARDNDDADRSRLWVPQPRSQRLEILMT